MSETPAPTPTQINQEEKKIPHLRIVPHIVDVRHCLYFDVIDRDVPEDLILKVGRFTEKASSQVSRIAFKSKVVSRSHAEIWSKDGQFFIKDTKSSSGTFLNHMRLAPPGVESKPYPLKDGDILQLGVDYQGGTMDIYKCVKIRLEINRTWQHTKENPFRQQVLKNIQNNYNATDQPKTDNSECCICLYSMAAFQALFVAPCSHCFHFKCIKPLLFTSTGFNCPLCRTYADLEASVEIDDVEMLEEDKILPLPVQQILQNQSSNQNIIAAHPASNETPSSQNTDPTNTIPIATDTRNQNVDIGNNNNTNLEPENLNHQPMEGIQIDNNEVNLQSSQNVECSDIDLTPLSNNMNHANLYFSLGTTPVESGTERSPNTN
ncbi:hypothetical protein BB559_004223 [Furculomyces boomerangus]|uniref:RING-type E3 ubiquitin transferase n=1 Tax=Furculomyces boomerangus TaxID=61424 RepID=A0A2T9YG02_9FUNG|nr:hypothetical protein BB559_004223 [Furculomyces boomerangus]